MTELLARLPAELHESVLEYLLATPKQFLAWFQAHPEHEAFLLTFWNRLLQFHPPNISPSTFAFLSTKIGCAECSHFVQLLPVGYCRSCDKKAGRGRTHTICKRYGIPEVILMDLPHHIFASPTMQWRMYFDYALQDAFDAALRRYPLGFDEWVTDLHKRDSIAQKRRATQSYNRKIRLMIERNAYAIKESARKARRKITQEAAEWAMQLMNNEPNESIDTVKFRRRVLRRGLERLRLDSKCFSLLFSNFLYQDSAVPLEDVLFQVSEKYYCRNYCNWLLAWNRRETLPPGTSVEDWALRTSVLGYIPHQWPWLLNIRLDMWDARKKKLESASGRYWSLEQRERWMLYGES